MAIRYSAYNTVEKIVLFGSPCVRTQQKLSFSTRVLKTIKKLPGMNKFGKNMKKYIGSRDYRNASPIMRETLVNVVNENLEEDAKKIDYSEYENRLAKVKES
mgnify:CR=1 FL=1